MQIPKDNLYLTIYQHLDELRTVLIRVALAFLVIFVIIFLTSRLWLHILIKLLLWNTHVHLNTFSLNEIIVTYLLILISLSFIVIFPYATLLFWRFISPGLKPSERNTIMIKSAQSISLFLGGILLNYFILYPQIFNWGLSIASLLGTKPIWGIQAYLLNLLYLSLLTGLLFQIPLITHFLVKIDVLSRNDLSSQRKYVYFVCLILSSLFAPPDLVMHLSFFIIMITLYEMTIFYIKIKES
ncbi:hypothetical protein CD133_01895 [Staphylococcus massiliensis CCUG 55927]|nr:hypothetical protein CD133_01895 [Staphylococcus massiliensis CCUG 55927]